MAKSTLITIADDVLTLIEATVETNDGEAERVYVPSKSLEDLATLTVSVVGRNEERKRSDRASFQRDYTIDIGVRQKVDADGKTEEEFEAAIDDLGELLETLANLLEDTPLPVVTAGLVEVIVSGPDQELLDRMSVFVGWVRATYRVMRRLP